MADYTSRVGLDTTNYEQGIKSLFDIMQAFNRESERADRVQKMLSATTKRSGEDYKLYQKSIVDLRKQTDMLIRKQKELGQLRERYAIQKTLTGQSEIARYTKSIAKLEDQIERAQVKKAELNKALNTSIDDGGLKPLTHDLQGMGNAVGVMNERLKSAHARLANLHKKYEHFGRITRGMQFGDDLVKDLTKLGLPKDILEGVQGQVKQIRQELNEIARDPKLQEAMRVDKVLGNAEQISKEYREAYDKINSAMGPYLQRNKEAQALQTKINQLLQREVSLRDKIANSKLARTGPTKTEDRLKEVGQELFDKQEELQRLGQQRSQRVASALLKDERFSIPQRGLSVEDQTRGHRLRAQIDQELSAIRGEDPARVLRLMFTGTPQERAEMQERFGNLYSAVRQVERLKEQAAAADKRRISEINKREAEAEQQRIAREQRKAAARSAYNYREQLRQEDPLSRFKTTTFEDQVEHNRLLNNLRSEMSQLSVRQQKEAQDALKSQNAQEVAEARQKYSGLHRAEEDYNEFLRRMRAQDLKAEKEAEEKKTAATKREIAKRERAEKEAAAAKERVRVGERVDRARQHPSLQNLIPVDASFGQKVLVQKEINALADAYARTKQPMSQFDNTLSEIRRGNLRVIRQFPKVAEGLRRVEVAAHEADRTVRRVGLSWEAIGRLTFARALTHVFYGMTTQFWETARAAKEINLQIAQIQTISTQIPQSMNQWRDAIRDLSEEFTFAQEDVGHALYETISNQIAEGPQAVDINRVIAPFALTTGSTLADSVNLISSALNSFNLEATDAERVAAQLFATIDLGRVTATDMANTYGRVSTFTKQANVSMAEMNGMIARLTISGLRFERASTFIINVLNKLAKPTPAFQQFLSELGAASGEEALAIYGLPGILEKIFAANQGSLDELGKMVRDIRAIIGYSGLLQDLPQLQNTIDQIADENLENYRDKTRIVMESSAVVVGKEIAKMRGYFLDLQGTILDAAAATANFFNDNKITGSFSAVAEFATVSSLLASSYGALNLVRARTFGGDSKDVIRSMNEQYAGAEGARLNPSQRVARRYFLTRGASQRQRFAETRGGASLPGVGSAVGFALPRATGAAAIVTALAYFTRQAMPTITRFIAEANDSTEDLVKNVADGYKDIVEAAYDFRKQQKEAVTEDVKEITLAFGDVLREQREVLSNLNKDQARMLDTAEKRLEVEKNILKTTQDFVLKRYRNDLDFQVGLYQNPADQIFARGNILAAQRQDILGLAQQNPDLAGDLFGDWLNEAQSLRQEIQTFAQSEEDLRNLPLASQFMGMTDQMIDQMLGEVMSSLDVSPTGSLLGDLSAFQNAVSSRDTELTELKELRQFLEDRIEKGLDSWERTVDAVQTLNYTQQALFLKYFGGAAGVAPTDLGRALYEIVSQQGLMSRTESQRNLATIERREPSRRNEFEIELVNFLDLRNKQGVLSRAFSAIRNAATNLDTFWFSEEAGQLLQRRESLLSDIDAFVTTIKENNNRVPEDARDQVFPLLKSIDELVDDTYRALGSTVGGSTLGNMYGWLTKGDEYFSRIQAVNEGISDIAERARVFADPRSYMLEYLRPRTAEFTQQDAWAQFLELSRNPPEVTEAEDVKLDANTVAITARELRLMSQGAAQYRASGGAIGGPRGTDTVPAWLTPGEFVVNARSAAQHAGLLHAINSQYFDRGGRASKVLDMEAFREWEKTRRSGAIRGGNYGPTFSHITGPGGERISFDEWYANRYRRRSQPSLSDTGIGLANLIKAWAESRLNDQNSVQKKSYLTHGRNVSQEQKRRELMERAAEVRRDTEAMIAENFAVTQFDYITKFLLGAAAAPLVPAAASAGSIASTIGTGLGTIGGAAGHSIANALLAALYAQPLGSAGGTIGGIQFGIGAAGAGAASLPFLKNNWDWLNPFQDPQGNFQLGLFGFNKGGRVPSGSRSYNVRPAAGAGYYSQGGMVTNSTVVNAEINLTSTGSTARDVREIVRGINRETHRGGLNVRN